MKTENRARMQTEKNCNQVEQDCILRGRAPNRFTDRQGPSARATHSPHPLAITFPPGQTTASEEAITGAALRQRTTTDEQRSYSSEPVASSKEGQGPPTSQVSASEAAARRPEKQPGQRNSRTSEAHTPGSGRSSLSSS